MLTERDKLIYREIFGDDGVYQDMLTWDVTTPLTLYKTKEYKKYKGQYLNVIFDKVKEEFTDSNVNRYQNFYFKGKYGEVYRGEFEVSGKPKVLDILDINKLGADHLKEFIDYYTYDIVINYIQEDLEDLGDVYRNELYNNLIKVSFFMVKEFRNIDGSEDIYTNTWDSFLMDAVQGNVDEYFNETGQTKDLYANKWYRELQDRVMGTIRDKNEREYNRIRPRFTSLWGD